MCACYMPTYEWDEEKLAGLTSMDGVHRLWYFQDVMNTLAMIPSRLTDVHVNEECLDVLTGVYLPYIVGAEHCDEAFRAWYGTVKRIAECGNRDDRVDYHYDPYVSGRVVYHDTLVVRRTVPLFIAALGIMSPVGGALCSIYQEDETNAMQCVHEVKQCVRWVLHKRPHLFEGKRIVPEIQPCTHAGHFTITSAYGAENVIRARPVHVRHNRPAESPCLFFPDFNQDTAGFGDFVLPLIRDRKRTILFVLNRESKPNMQYKVFYTAITAMALQ